MTSWFSQKNQFKNKQIFNLSLIRCLEEPKALKIQKKRAYCSHFKNRRATSFTFEPLGR